ncbi:hypothetical protein A6A25_02475 [Saccharothrix sp. CB00851]|nr:hypothetical protein A6A25_02475 [Saccharothrix sp. CB00851]
MESKLPRVGELRYVRLYGEVQEIVVSVFDERLVRELGGTISARLTTGPDRGVYRNFSPDELKTSPGAFAQDRH